MIDYVWPEVMITVVLCFGSAFAGFFLAALLFRRRCAECWSELNSPHPLMDCPYCGARIEHNFGAMAGADTGPLPGADSPNQARLVQSETRGSAEDSKPRAEEFHGKTGRPVFCHGCDRMKPADQFRDDAVIPGLCITCDDQLKTP